VARSKIEAFTELSQFTVHGDSVKLLDYDYCQENHVVVLDWVDTARADPVTVGLLDPADEGLIGEVRQRLNGRQIRPVRLNAFEIQRALDEGYGRGEPVGAEVFLRLKGLDEVSFAPDQKVSSLLNQVLGHAVKLEASDVHFETYQDDVDVRFRIDGMLRQINTPLNVENMRAVVVRLKVLADLDITETRRAQDGRVSSVFDGERKVFFRVSVIPGPHGEDAVLRILDHSGSRISLQALGMAEGPREAFADQVEHNTEGLVLVTGPTGSGKTTTLYSLVDRINDETNKLLTVEDPVERLFAKVNQKQVTAQMGFADYARAFLRQSPDVILIGEIRDNETAEVALRAAHTGHLVISSLHTSNSVQAVARLQLLGGDLSTIADCLLCSMAQRLLRKLCPECRREAAPSPGAARLLGDLAGTYYEAAGCDACGGVGYYERTGVFELFLVDYELEAAIDRGDPLGTLRSMARSKGMVTLLEDALDKASAGITSLDEVIRVLSTRSLAEGRRLDSPGAP
jgi:general secretion pathway protein E